MNKERFDEIMSAIVFAESGEHEEAKRLIRKKDKVLAAISDVAFDNSIFAYALAICKRTSTALEILYLTKTGLHMDELSTFMKNATEEGVACSLTKTEGCMKQAILDHTSKRREVLFVIVGTTPELDLECKTGERTLSEAWKRLKCPLVIVSKGDELPSIA